MFQSFDDEVRGCANQGRIPIVVLGNVVASGCRPIRALNEKAEVSLLFGREEDVERRFLDFDDALGLILAAGLKLEADFNRYRFIALRNGNRLVKNQPSFLVGVAAALTDDRNLPRIRPGDFLAQIDTARFIGKDVFDFLDFAKKQECPRRRPRSLAAISRLAVSCGSFEVSNQKTKRVVHPSPGFLVGA